MINRLIIINSLLILKGFILLAFFFLIIARDIFSQSLVDDLENISENINEQVKRFTLINKISVKSMRFDF